MPLIKTKWKAKYGCTVVEKFYYTETGQYFTHHTSAFEQTVLARKVDEDIHEGRVMLARTQQGKFFVDWSTRNMFKIEHEVLGLCRDKLKEYLDSLRTKSLVSDVETWTKIILWSWDSAVCAAAALDPDGKIVRLAIWDTSKKQYVPKQELVLHGHTMAYEPFTVERWRQVESGLTLTKEFKDAETVLHQELACFKLRENNDAHVKAMRSLRDSLRKQTSALIRERGRLFDLEKCTRKTTAKGDK